ncbi:winged helix-turn-helix domain-containing protein [Kocuria palustris]|uniref:winged helix-turn-helix domain-containing protein n=1 Tax=Kocuria palustris TaxID=71999 RepID=UPI00243178D1|nr:crosslink repair DNA glycosylase YcaQ family protein [Kocuria palustris]
MTELTPAAARRIALAAQGFLDPRPEPGAATARHLNRVIDRVGVVQVDSVNVLTRSHYLPFFSRLGPYDRARLDRLRDRSPRRLVEYWAHEASLIPPQTWPLLAFRRDRARDEAWGGIRRIAQEQPELVERVLAVVASHGPLTARQCDALVEHQVPGRGDGWGWNWSAVKTALEFLFWSGQIISSGRNQQFERTYVLPERILPPELLERSRRMDAHEAHVELIRIAARAHGVASLRSLRDYFRLRADESRAAVVDLVAAGELEEVTVRGLGPAYLHAEARRPRRAHVEALVSPFDSLVWQRERTEALFGMRFRLEIYTPAAQRRHGYYVLPFVYGDTLVARADLKADRAADALRVQRLTWEPDAPAAARPALTAQLRSMAGWLELTDVVVAD